MSHLYGQARKHDILAQERLVLVVLICGLILFLAGTVNGQGVSSPDSGLVIRSTTNLVEVRVVAEDSKGKPVTGLQAADFEVFDNRKPQVITLFAAETRPQSHSPLPTNSTPVDPTSPGTEVSAYSVLVLDWLNLSYADRLFAQDKVVKLLKTYRPQQKLALYLLGHDPRFLRTFTSDMDDLLRAVGEADIEFGTAESDPPNRLTFGENLLFWQNRTFNTLHAFEQIENILSHVGGRKSLIWLSAGFPVTVDRTVIPGARPLELVFIGDVERALSKLNNADIAVHTVDAVGLSVSSRSFSDTLAEFALRTGGTVFVGRNDLDEGMRLAFEDINVGYTLGFHVPTRATVGRHEIRVRASRHGVRLRYRESYNWEQSGPGK